MYKRSVFTNVTPLPAYITRETVIEALHNHGEMIELNPLVIRHERCPPPHSAPADEFHCIWYEMTDRISYLPGGLVKGHVSYSGCFYDLPRGLQTHIYAPTGLDIREKWSVCGNMPGEPREPVELGMPNAPREGLYLREDVNMRSQIWSTAFVKRTLQRAHSVLVDRLVMKADLAKQRRDSICSSALDPSLRKQTSLLGDQHSTLGEEDPMLPRPHRWSRASDIAEAPGSLDAERTPGDYIAEVPGSLQAGRRHSRRAGPHVFELE
ncbi:hypothetical protein BDV26DRAFT_265208 [Aspergillus bertholletiae]|uniref:DUF7053 domain-containing protein n=1 Tax=Aspergillus bertholletiae TaxID=1226010 RepID=A0A5N7B3B2_9EURO|nr:hypothetical protein BDV26DRAFT_265208 [Aspergillus bertholletiae]